MGRKRGIARADWMPEGDTDRGDGGPAHYERVRVLMGGARKTALLESPLRWRPLRNPSGMSGCPEDPHSNPLPEETFA